MLRRSKTKLVSKMKEDISKSTDSISFDETNATFEENPNRTPSRKSSNYDDFDEYSPKMYTMSQRAHLNGMDVVWASPNSSPIQQTILKRPRPQPQNNISPIIKKPSAGRKGFHKFMDELQKRKLHISNQNEIAKYSKESVEIQIDDDDNVDKIKSDDKQTNDWPTELNLKAKSLSILTNVDKVLDKLKNPKPSTEIEEMEIISDIIPVDDKDPPPKRDSSSPIWDEFPSDINFYTNQNMLLSRRDSFDDFLCSANIDKIIEQSQSVVQKNSTTTTKTTKNTVKSSDKYNKIKNKSHSESDLIRREETKLKLCRKTEKKSDKIVSIHIIEDQHPQLNNKRYSEESDSRCSVKWEDLDSDNSIDDIMCSLNTEKIIAQSKGGGGKETAAVPKRVPCKTIDQDSRFEADESLDKILCSSKFNYQQIPKKSNFIRYNSTPENIQKHRKPAASSTNVNLNRIKSSTVVTASTISAINTNCTETSSSLGKKQKSLPILNPSSDSGVSMLSPSTMEMIKQNRLEALERQKKSRLIKKSK